MKRAPEPARPAQQLRAQEPPRAEAPLRATSRSGFRAATAFAAAATLAGASCSLQGCDVPHVSGYLVVSDLDVATHQVAQWRMEPEYWTQNSYLDPDTGKAEFNSCMNPMLSLVEVCSGHGNCAPFDPDTSDTPVFFCKCDAAWGGLECASRRKRQSVAWLMSMLFGPLGFDELYLGLTQQAIHKALVCLLGAIFYASGLELIGASIVGVTWMFDVVRIGSGPVLTSTHRVQPDLPRLAFAFLTIFHFCFVGVAVATASMYRTILVRRRHADHVQSYSSMGSAKMFV